MAPNVAMIVLALLLLLVATAASEEREVCPSPFVKIGTECYSLLLHNHNWADARIACSDLAPSGEVADLAKLDSCEQHSKLWQYILMNDHKTTYWVGSTDENEEGFWHWVDGSPVDMSPPMLQWVDGQPDGGTGQNCLTLDGGQLRDLECTRTYYAICQLG